MANERNHRRPSPIVASRLGRCRRLMKKHKVRGFLVSNPADYFYLTGFSGEDSAVLLTPREIHVITDGRFDESSNHECPWARKWLRKGTLNAEIGRVVKEIRLASLAVQTDHLTVSNHDDIRKQTKLRKLATPPPITGQMRRCKDATELTAIRRAIKIAEDAFEATRAAIRRGQTELDLAARLEYEMKIRGASAPSFPAIVAEGPNAALPHAKPGKRRVREGSAILFDWGARFGGYCSDLTRMVFVGSISDRMRQVYGVVLEAQRRAIEAIRPGARMCDVDAVARDSVKEAGFGEAFNHGLGHGLGLDVHEPPALSWRSTEKLVAGMVVTVEPGVYLPGVGGVRIEDDVLLTPKGCRILTNLDRSVESALIRAR